MLRERSDNMPVFLLRDLLRRRSGANYIWRTACASKMASRLTFRQIAAPSSGAVGGEDQRAFAIERPVEAGFPPGMAGFAVAADLDLEQQGVLIAVDAQ